MSTTLHNAMMRVSDLTREAENLRLEGRHDEANQLESRIEALMADIARISEL